MLFGGLAAPIGRAAATAPPPVAGSVALVGRAMATGLCCAAAISAAARSAAALSAAARSSAAAMPSARALRRSLSSIFAALSLALFCTRVAAISRSTNNSIDASVAAAAAAPLLITRDASR